MQAFLETAGYYHQNLPDFATVAKSLTRLVSGESSWTWNSKEQMAFQCLKDGLLSAPVLGYPDPVHSRHRRKCCWSRSGLLSDAGGRGASYHILQQDIWFIRKELLHYSSRTAGSGESSKAFQTISIRHQVWHCRQHEPTAQVAHWLEPLRSVTSKNTDQTSCIAMQTV